MNSAVWKKRDPYITYILPHHLNPLKRLTKISKLGLFFIASGFIYSIQFLPYLSKYINISTILYLYSGSLSISIDYPRDPLLITGAILISFLLILTGRHIFQSLNPLYAFGNLGHKIQSLTPRISEQSKQIESGFRGDMDFRVLSQSFDSLASTFSDIVALVIKLEKVEQKANKGDLFDSTKYINSLREDIRTPLLSLRTFLEKKKTELQNSQQELMKVRVNVGGEGENRELQSICSKELIKELDENIGKLDVMMEKI